MAEEAGPRPRVNAFQIVVALVVVSAVFLGYVLATRPSAPPSAGLRVQVGDSVTVDYIGFFEDGKVFDTSFLEVAEDNATYPKAVSFGFREEYQPLQFTVTGPGEEGTVIQGVAEGVLGLREGETRLVEVSPEKGYGSPDPSLVETRPLVVELPQRETLRVAEFADRYGPTPMSGLTVQDPKWGWSVTVLSLANDFVTFLHVPEAGSTANPFGGWLAEVMDVDSGANGGVGAIVVRHLLDPASANNVRGSDGRGAFRVVEVNPAEGTYTVDYNPEVVGQTLFFELTVVRITRA